MSACLKRMSESIRKTILVAAACWAAAVSCMRDMSLDAMDDPQLIVECILTDEPVQTLYLSYTKGASQEKALDVPEATAVLSDLTEGKEIGRFNRSADRSWHLAYAAVPTHRYRLDVSIPNREPIWAEQSMPEAPGISTRWSSWKGVYEKDPSYRQDQGHVFRMMSPKDPVWFYGINYLDFESPGELTSWLCTDYPDVDPFNEDSKSNTRETGGKALGAAWLATAFYPSLYQAPRHQHYLRFPAKDYDWETQFLISGDFQGCISSFRDIVRAKKRSAELRYFSSSEDYDRFLKESSELMAVKTSSDLSSVFLRENVYSNIQGAKGLFGAKIEKTLEWESEDTWGADGTFLLSAFHEVGKESDDPWAQMGNFHLSASAGGISTIPFELLCYDINPIISYPIGKSETSFAYIQSGKIGVVGEFSEVRADYIQNEDQLIACGLGEYRPVDFSKKDVLLYTYVYPKLTESQYGILPVFIGCGKSSYPGDVNLYIYFVKAEDAAVHVWSLRVAILIDKLELNPSLRCRTQNYTLPPYETEMLKLALKDLTGERTNN